MQAIAYTAFAGLAIALGCPPERVRELFSLMREDDLPTSPQDAVNKFAAGIQRLGPPE